MEKRVHILVTAKKDGTVLVDRDVTIFAPEEEIAKQMKEIASDGRGQSIEIDVEFSDPKGGQA